ncbi:hypothetical protein PMAYCL1PPCAC_17678, partial [Pristionchus mayeri]
QSDLSLSTKTRIGIDGDLSDGNSDESSNEDEVGMHCSRLFSFPSKSSFYTLSLSTNFSRLAHRGEQIQFIKSSFLSEMMCSNFHQLFEYAVDYRSFIVIGKNL